MIGLDHMDLTTRCAIPSASDQKLLLDLCINCTTCSTADTNRSSCASLTTSGGEIFNTMKSLPQTWHKIPWSRNSRMTTICPNIAGCIFANVSKANRFVKE
jgi:hypothetical protein